MKAKLKLNGGFLGLARINRLSIISYTVIAVLPFLIALAFAMEERAYLKDILSVQASYADGFGLGGGLVGYIAGVTAAACFGDSKKGMLLYSLPGDVRGTFGKVALWELIKGAAALLFSAFGYLAAVLLMNNEEISPDIKYFFSILGFVFFYFFIYFSVGVLAGTVAGRTVTRALVAFAYCFTSVFISFWACGVCPRLHDGRMEFLAVLRKPFVYNVPYGRYLIGANNIVENIGKTKHEELLLYNEYAHIFGALITVCFFIAVSVWLLKRRAIEKAGDPFCFRFIGGAVHTLLTVTVYYAVFLRIWNKKTYVIDRIAVIFEKGAFRPVLSDLPYFICFFLIFSALCACSAKKMLNNIRVLPVAVFVTYVLQIVIALSVLI